MQCIIFSFNRACQLDTLLKSIRKFLGNLTLDTYVVYNSSDALFEEGYLLLQELFPEVHFVKERKINNSVFLNKGEYGYWKNYYNFFKYPAKTRGGSFKADIMDILRSGSSGLTFFLTDDSMFISAPSVAPDVERNILKNPSNAAFSFRHGMNIADTPKASLSDHGTYVHYPVNKQDGAHWTFRFSIDGHVYATEYLISMLSRIHFYNPNSFESFVNTYSERKDLFQHLYFNKANSLVGFELNRVQSFNVNNHLNFSTEKLNAYFLKQYELKYLFSTVNDFRPELNGLEFSKNGDMFQIKL